MLTGTILIMQSSVDNPIDRKAPLATFDTEDLGEEDAFITSSNSPAFHAENAKFSAEKEISNVNNNSGRLGASGIQNSKEFSFNVGNPFSKSMNTNYRKFSDGNENSSQTSDGDFSAVSSLENSSRLSSDSNSDSSESDGEYIRSGYISVDKGKVSQHEVKPDFGSSQGQRSESGWNGSSSDNTPFSSPILPRVSVSTLLNELQNEKVQSKRKALEKRIQRLQVTNKPVERPRSTTPINIHTFDEYKGFDSPEKSPCVEAAEKLKIKLPGEEFSPKLRSPRKNRTARKDNSAFVFSEDHLFSRTKSALFVQNDGDTELSPKRILLPPALSPLCSPLRSPGTVRSGEIQGNCDHKTAQKTSRHIRAHSASQLSSDTAWDAFTQASAIKRNSNPWCDPCDAPETGGLAQFFLTPDQLTKDKDKNTQSTPNITIKHSDSDSPSHTEFAESICKEFLDDKDEVLTVKIEEVEGHKVCDITCDTEQGTTDANTDNTTRSLGVVDQTETNLEENFSLKLDLIAEIEREMQSRNKLANHPTVHDGNQHTKDTRNVTHHGDGPHNQS